MKLYRYLLAALLYALPTAAFAQCSGSIASGSVCANSAAGSGFATATTPTAWFDRWCSSTNNGVPVRLSGTWACLASANNSIWATSGTGVPSLTQTLPSAVQVAVGSLNSGTSAGATTFWNGTGAWLTAVTSVTCNGGQTIITTSGTCASAETLTAGRNYFIRTDGNDSFCTGLTNAAYVSGAFPQNCGFATVQKSFDAYALLNTATNTVVVNVADGTYTATATLSNCAIGGGVLLVQGNTSTPSNVLFNVTGTAFSINSCPNVQLTGFKVQATNNGIEVNGNATSVTLSNYVAGTTTAMQLVVNSGKLLLSGNFSIVGGAAGFAHLINGGQITTTASTGTLSGTPAFSSFFYGCSENSYSSWATTWSGSATGKHTIIHQGCVTETTSLGVDPDTYFPGSTASSPVTNASFNDISAQAQLLCQTAPAGSAPAGTTYTYCDSTSKAFANKDDAGTVHTTVVADTGASNNFLTAISAAGVISKAQPSVSNLSGFGTGVATALGVNVGSAGAPVLFNGAGGTPSSITLTSGTGLPLTTGVTGTLPSANGGLGVANATVNLVSPAVNVNLGSAADTTITIPLPTGHTRIQNVQLFLTGASGNISTGTFGLFTATGGGGTAIIAAGTAITITTASDNTNGNMQEVNQANINTMSILPVANQIFFRVGTTVAQTVNVQVKYIASP